MRLLREHGLSSLVTLLLHPRVPVQVVGGRVHAAPLTTTFLTTLKDQKATVAVGAAAASARRHLTRVEDQLRCIGTLGKALWALVVSRWRKPAEKAVAAFVRLLKGIFEDPFGTAQRRGARLLLLVFFSPRRGVIPSPEGDDSPWGRFAPKPSLAVPGRADSGRACAAWPPPGLPGLPASPAPS